MVAAPDKFRGTAAAAEVAAAIAAAVTAAGATCDAVPVADGGEGTLAVLGGPNRTRLVTGPLGDPLEARWRYGGRTAVVEMALASGLELVGGAAGNDPMAASTFGTGELIGAAVDAGCRRVIVGVGGSATVDGGLGALRALEPISRLRGIELVVACDVRTRFVDAARTFGPQKGASAAQVELLHRRLERLVQMYEQTYGVDVSRLEGAGAAGGLAGGLAVAGAELVPGFDVVADEVDLFDRMEGADLVVTGEGFLDEQSFEGKVVGGVCDLARSAGVPVLAVVGEVLEGITVPEGLEVLSLVAEVGGERAFSHTAAAVQEVVTRRLAAG
ncbi:MAG: glycerate kinase [Actinomycetota bacterium]|nr:glycerate kinase [Actinomycetota bacterium]